MLKINNIVFVALLVLCVNVNGQNSYNSAFTRYGLGDLHLNGNNQNKALGATGITSRHQNQINFINPAAYTAQDTMSFIFDFGVRAVLLDQKTSSATNESYNYNLDHLAISFPVTKWWYGSVGLLPYSEVGYRISNTINTAEDITIDQGYSGEGGLNKFYIGSAFSPLKNLNIGFNLSYLFGSINHKKYINFTNNTAIDFNQQTVLYAKGFVLNTGAQFGFYINPKNKVTLGAIYDLSSALNTEITNEEYSLWSQKDTINYSFSDSSKLGIPFLFGVGINYSWNEKISLSFDYKTQDWSNANVFESSNIFSKYEMLGLGVEITPDKEDYRNYLNKIQYRIGVRTSNAYIRIPDDEVVNNELKNQALTFGLGLPFKSNTTFNITVEMGKRGSITDNLLEEKYTKISFNVSLYDFWFYKPKYD